MKMPLFQLNSAMKLYKKPQKHPLKDNISIVFYLIVAFLINPLSHAMTLDDFKCQPPQSKDLQILDHLPLHQYQLKNGLRVLISPNHSRPFFTMRLVYGVGSRDELKGQSGYAHLVEHLMFKGASHSKDGDYMSTIAQSGGTANASTDYDRTDFWSQLPISMLPRALWMEADRMQGLELSPNKINNQRQAVLEEKALRLTNQPYLNPTAHFIIQQWRNTPYGHLLIGTDKDLNAADQHKMEAWLAKYYHPSNAVIAITGDVDPKQTFNLIKRYFSTIAKGNRRTEITDQAIPQVSFTKKLYDPMAPWPVYAIAWNTPGFAHKDSLYIRTINNLLFQNPDGLITRILLEQKRLALAIQHLDYGFQYLAMANAIIVPHAYASQSRIKNTILKSLQQITQNGIPQNDICRVMKSTFQQQLSRYKNPLALVTVLSNDLLVHNNPLYSKKILQDYVQTSPEQMQQILLKYFSKNFMFISIQPAWYIRWLKTLGEWMPDSWGRYLENKIL